MLKINMTRCSSDRVSGHDTLPHCFQDCALERCFRVPSFFISGSILLCVLWATGEEVIQAVCTYWSGESTSRVAPRPILIVLCGFLSVLLDFSGWGHWSMMCNHDGPEGGRYETGSNPFSYLIFGWVLITGRRCCCSWLVGDVDAYYL